MRNREAEIAWAAGLFEGEGSISLRKQAMTPQLSLAMVDKDVVDRFHETVGIGTRFLRTHPPHKSHYQVQYVWHAASIESVRTIAALFLPYFGDRRRRQMLDALDGYNTADIKRRPKGRDTCVNGHRWDEKTSYIDPQGRRSCRECNRIKGNKRYHAQKAFAAQGG